jgi:hypothetical protein
MSMAMGSLSLTGVWNEFPFIEQHCDGWPLTVGHATRFQSFARWGSHARQHNQEQPEERSAELE